MRIASCVRPAGAWWFYCSAALQVVMRARKNKGTPCGGQFTEQVLPESLFRLDQMGLSADGCLDCNASVLAERSRQAGIRPEFFHNALAAGALPGEVMEWCHLSGASELDIEAELDSYTKARRRGISHSEAVSAHMRGIHGSRLLDYALLRYVGTPLTKAISRAQRA